MVRLRRSGYRLAYRLATVWWFVRRPHTHGVKLVIRDGERVAFVRHTYGPAVWEIPGGGRRRKESAVLAARREAREELGLTLEDWHEVGVLVDRRHATAHLTCLVGVWDSEPLRPDGAEIAEVRWSLINEPPRPLGDHARDCLHLLELGDTREQRARG